jgi:hypothetical protein
MEGKKETGKGNRREKLKANREKKGREETE